MKSLGYLIRIVLLLKNQKAYLYKINLIVQHFFVQKQKMRPASQRSASVNGAKPGFQTKMKSRVGGGNEEFNMSMNSSRQQNCTLFNSRHNHDECKAKDSVFNKSFSDIYKSNFQHHDPQRCVCESCDCGRHLCKLHVVKPNLSKNTIYQRSFHGKKALENVVNHDKEYERLNGPHLGMASTYAHELPGRKGDKVVKPHPEDLLKSGGPAQNLTSYSSQFPGYKGGNQYVKPTDKHTRADFPLRSRSEYNKEFPGKAAKKDDYTYYPDQLKTGSNWYGKTTYGDFFADQNPEYHAKKVKVLEKRNPIAGSNHMYETTYKNDFLTQKSSVCPAKIVLETTNPGAFNESKYNFSENTDFKAFSPTYHAISTSKHSYV